MGHTPALYRHWESCVEENQRLRQELHDRERTIEHLVQANHALHDELAAARARIAALENQLDELGEGAYRAAAERDNRYVPQLHECKGRAERAEAELARMRLVVGAARRFVQALDATEVSIRPDPEGVIDGPHGQALRAAVAALDAAREEATA